MSKTKAAIAAEKKNGDFAEDYGLRQRASARLLLRTLRLGTFAEIH